MGADWSRVIKNSLKELTIDHVEETDKVIGRGAYGEVIVVKMGGLRCASKKIHKTLVEDKPFATNEVVRKFIQECTQMSKLHHPNIVQFLGVYFDCSPIPSLVMELLPTSLGAFLEEYDDVPRYIKHSILLDIAVALLYLHSHSPPIIHRDLTVNNVLLTRGLKAKIADLGVARTLPPSYTQSRNAPMMTLVPGNSNYMPPEARKEIPSYDTKLDIFSFGHLIIHVVLQKWPMILDEFYRPFPDDPEFKEYRTELDRRQKCIEEIEDTNSLKSLVVDCLQDDPDDRPTTCNVVIRLETISSYSPLPYSTPVDVLRALEDHSGAGQTENANLKQMVAKKTSALEEKTHALEEKARALQELEEKYQKLLAGKEEETGEEVKLIQAVPIPRASTASGVNHSRPQPKMDFQPAVPSTPIGAGELVEDIHWQQKTLENRGNGVADLSITPEPVPRAGTAWVHSYEPAVMASPSHLPLTPPPRPPPPNEPLPPPSPPNEPLPPPSPPNEPLSPSRPLSKPLPLPSPPNEPFSPPRPPSEPLPQPSPPNEPLSPSRPLSKPLSPPSPPNEPFSLPRPPSEPLPQSSPPSEPLLPPNEPLPQLRPPNEPLPQPRPPNEPLPQSQPPSEPHPQPVIPRPPSEPLPQPMTSSQPTVSRPSSGPHPQAPPPTRPRPLSGSHLNPTAKATPRQPLPLAFILQSEPPPKLTARQVPRPLSSWPPPPPPKRSQSKLSARTSVTATPTNTSELPAPRSQPLPRSKAITGKNPPDGTQPMRPYGRALSVSLKRPAHTQSGRTMDPKLAALLNRQQQKIEENKPGEGIAQLEASRTEETAPKDRPRAQTLPGTMRTARTIYVARNPPEIEAGQRNT